MDKILDERLEDIVNLIPRLSWEIMDEAQKDELMEGVILPRYKAVTKDGTKLGPTTWAAMLGTTAQAIRDRVYRLNQAKKPGARNVAESRAKQKDLATARRVIANPETAKAFIESMPIETKIEVAKAVTATPASPPISKKREKKTKAAIAPLRRTVNDFAAVMGTVSLIDRATDEINEAVGRDGLGAEALGQVGEAIDRLVAAYQFAKEMGGVTT